MCEEVLKTMNRTNYTASNTTYAFPEDLIQNGILAPPLGMIRFDVVSSMKNTGFAMLLLFIVMPSRPPLPRSLAYY